MTRETDVSTATNLDAFCKTSVMSDRMTAVTDTLAVRLASVRHRITQAVLRAGRDPASVQLVCVTKGVCPDTIREGLALGMTDLGENRLQEARLKQNALGCRLEAPGEGSCLDPQALTLEPIVRWHMIGHLQRNKVKDAVGFFHAIHSVDSVELAHELERRAAQFTQGSSPEGPRAGGQGRGQNLGFQPSVHGLEPKVEIFIQVNISKEQSKFGCSSKEALSLSRDVLQLSHLRLVGLMTLAPYSTDPESSRPVFRKLRGLRDDLNAVLVNAPTRQPTHPPTHLRLSMGMSNDFEVAIEEGADYVRIGTAIFGARGVRVR